MRDNLVRLPNIPFRVPAGMRVETFSPGAGVVIYRLDGLSVEDTGDGVTSFELDRRGQLIQSTERWLDYFQMEQYLLARQRDRGQRH